MSVRNYVQWKLEIEFLMYQDVKFNRLFFDSNGINFHSVSYSYLLLIKENIRNVKYNSW